MKLTHRPALSLTFDQIVSELRNRPCENPDFHRNKEIIAEALGRLATVTNAAMIEQFDLSRGLIRKKINALKRRVITNQSQKAQLRALQIIWSQDEGIPPIHVNSENAIKALDLTDAVEREVVAKIVTDGKEFFDNQIRTMAKLMFTVLLNPEKSGTVIGALQSGKTGIGMAIQLMMAPMIYLLTGVRMFPRFISTSQSNHVAQSQDALNCFLHLYGKIEFYAIGDNANSATVGGYFRAFVELMNEDMRDFQNKNEAEDRNFRSTPTMRAYREVIARYDNPSDHDEMKEAEDVLQRTNGQSVNDIHKMMQIAKKNNFYLLLILDEPQWGSSGDFAHYKNGKMRGGVLNQMFYDKMIDLISPDSMHMLIGLSATPFGLTEAAKMFSITAYLPDDYYGPNCYDGRLIDPSKPEQSPNIYALETLDIELDIPEANLIWPLITFDRAKLPETNLDDETYRAECRRKGATLLRRLFDDMVSDPDNGSQYGMLLRLENNNLTTEAMIIESGLDQYFNIVRFFDRKTEEAQRLSRNLKAELNKHRGLNEKPVLILVTGKARMGDSFPAWVEFFMDCSKSTTGDMNSKLQNVYGRGCGVSKKHSKVFVNSGVATDLKNYLKSRGGVVAKGSPHTILVSPEDGEKVERSQCLVIGNDKISDPTIESLITIINEAIAFSGDGHADIAAAGGDNKIDITSIIYQSGIVPYINTNWDRFSPNMMGELVDPSGFRAQKMKTKGKITASQRLVWPKADGNTTITIRHSSPKWYEHNDPFNRSFEANNRYSITRKLRIGEADTDKVVMWEGECGEIDDLLDFLRQYERSNGRIENGPLVDMTDRIDAFKATIEAKHSDIWPGRFSSLKLLGGKDKTINRVYADAEETFTLVEEGDGHIQMFTLGGSGNTSAGYSGIAVIKNLGPQEGHGNKIRPQILHEKGVIKGIAWPADCSVVPHNDEGEGDLNIQINCAKFDLNGDEILDKAVPGLFRVVGICLPLMEKGTPWIRGSRHLVIPTNFANDALSKSQIAEQALAYENSGKTIPIKPDIGPFPTKTIRHRGRSRMARAAE